MAMRTYMLNQPVLEALVARFQSAAMASALTEIRAAVAAKYAVMLQPPAQVLAFAPPPSMLPALPVLGMIDSDSRLTDDTGSSLTGEHDVGVVAYLANPDPDMLAWGLRYYMQAVVEVAMEGRNLGTGSADGAWGTGARRIIWGPMLQDEDPQGRARTMSWATFVLWARREEIA